MSHDPLSDVLRGVRLRVGLISDTHGLLRPEAVARLQACHHIVHGGDIGNARVLHELSAQVSVTAVRGNNDKGPWAEALPEAEFLTLGEVSLYVLHDLAQLAIDPPAAGVRVVVSGHSHKPLIVERDGVLYVNPGSAGPRRFKLPITIGELDIEGTEVSARIIEL
jgi:putative phosphoesterase